MTEALTYGGFHALLGETFAHLPDLRRGSNTIYTMADAAWGAFSVFFMQCPSFLAHQRLVQQRKGANNAQTLFGITRIPSDPQVRNLLDSVDPAALREPFWSLLESAMTDEAVMGVFRTDGRWLVSLDGTQYFGSRKIRCPNCSVREEEESTFYSHTAVVPALVRPGGRDVLALEPEFITPQDGADKQDSERSAARRWVLRNGPRLAPHHVTVLADDLHCNQPFAELLLGQGLDFILTCKPTSHATLYEEVELLAKLGAVGQREERVWTGKVYDIWRYRFAEHVPLREPPKQLYANWCELTIRREGTEEVVFQNAWATNHPLSAETVVEVVAMGRARWKVENEGYNVLKRHGYALEHNFGHGQQHLAAVLVMLMLLAFLWHTLLGVVDNCYRRLREALGARRTFFNDLRALTRYHVFTSWQALMDFMLEGLELAPG